MPPTAPSATLPTEPPRTVLFDYGRLEAIELAMDKSVMQIVGEQLAMRPVELQDVAEPTPEQIAGVARKLKLGFAARFVAACLDVKLQDLAPVVPAAKLWGCYFALAVAFAEAIAQLAGGDEPADPPEPRPATDGASPRSDASAPGPASSSG